MLTIDINFIKMLSDGPEVSLKGSPYRIAYNGRLMARRTLAAKVALLYRFLCIVPCAARIGHEHGQSETR